MPHALHSASAPHHLVRHLGVLVTPHREHAWRAQGLRRVGAQTDGCIATTAYLYYGYPPLHQRTASHLTGRAALPQEGVPCGRWAGRSRLIGRPARRIVVGVPRGVDSRGGLGRGSTRLRRTAGGRAARATALHGRSSGKHALRVQRCMPWVQGGTQGGCCAGCQQAARALPPVIPDGFPTGGFGQRTCTPGPHTQMICMQTRLGQRQPASV